MCQPALQHTPELFALADSAASMRPSMLVAEITRREITQTGRSLGCAGRIDFSLELDYPAAKTAIDRIALLGRRPMVRIINDTMLCWDHHTTGPGGLVS